MDGSKPSFNQKSEDGKDRRHPDSVLFPEAKVFQQQLCLRCFDSLVQIEFVSEL